jgi:hypothetical protein
VTKSDVRKIDISALALVVVGEFAAVQDTIDGIVNLYARRRAPSLVDFLKSRGVLKQIRDKERPALLQAIATESQVQSDLSKFHDVFHRVCRVRDAIAHAAMTERVDADTLRLTKSVWSGAGAAQGDKPTVTTVSRDQLESLLRDARWLLQHVRFVIGADDLVFKMHYRGQLLTLVQPPADPADWDGQEWA